MPSKELINLINELKIVKMTLQKEKPKFLKIERYKCETNNGKILYREKLLKNNNNGSASIILPITTNNKVILTVQPRVFTSLTVGISLPAGYLDNDTYWEAALRELREETGYVPKKLIECATFYQDDGCSASLNKGFIALDCERKYKQELDKDEYINYYLCSIEELLKLSEEGIILDANSQLVIEKTKEYLIKR